MTPIVGPDGINVSPEVVIPAVLVAVAIALVGGLVYAILIATSDEFANLAREYGPIALYKALRRRPNMPDTPWFCDRCSSWNGVATTRCYKCDARREEHTATTPDAEEPAGPSAGLNQRTRRQG